MEVELIEKLAKLRLAIGFLGEKEQFGRWQSSFFTQGSDAFLSPLFGRTQMLAQCNGVTQAAAMIHDERIGVGNVYHLFRLPEDVEQNIHKILQGMKHQNFVNNKEIALDYLRKHSERPDKTSLGPTCVGNKKSLHELHPWRIISGLYLYAFEKEVEIYPYFTGTL